MPFSFKVEQHVTSDHGHISSGGDKRSTVLSVAGLAGRLFFAVTALPIGYADSTMDLPDALRLQAVALVWVLGAGLVLREWVPAKYETVKPHAK
jgi:hypothetical protein